MRFILKMIDNFDTFVQAYSMRIGNFKNELVSLKISAKQIVDSDSFTDKEKKVVLKCVKDAENLSNSYDKFLKSLNKMADMLRF